MLGMIFGNVVEVTLVSSVVIILLLILSKVLDRHFTAKWRYLIWLLIAIRLALPINFTLANPPVNLPTPEITNLLNAIANPQMSSAQGNSSAGLINKAIDIRSSITDQLGNRNFQLTDILLILWLVGTMIFILWQLINYRVFLRFIKSGCTVVRQPGIVSSYNEICREMKIKRKIPLMNCKQVSSPMVLGIWKQALLLPDVAFTPQQLKMVLCHELIHVRRRDILYKTLILLVRAIHWFNPLVHLMAREANKDVEASCDAAVVNNQNIEFRKDYSKTILMVIYNSRRSQVVFSTHFGGGKMIIMKRFASLFDMRKKRKGILPFIVVILVIGIIGLCVSCSQITGTTTTATTISKEQALLGKWVEEIAADIAGLPLDSIEFFADGTAKIADVYPATYKIVNGKLQCTVAPDIYTGDYKIDGTKLTITRDNGQSKVYIKK